MSEPTPYEPRIVVGESLGTLFPGETAMATISINPETGRASIVWEVTKTPGFRGAWVRFWYRCLWRHLPRGPRGRVHVARQEANGVGIGLRYRD